LGIAFPALKEAFQRHYRIEFAATPVEQAVSIIHERSKPIQDLLLAALEESMDRVPKENAPTRPWLAAVLDTADTGPWRKRAQQALQASDWKALEQVVEEAVIARQPPSRLRSLGWKTPVDSAIGLKLWRRIRQAYPGDFWVNHDLAGILHYWHYQPEEAIRYYTAAMALRPHNPPTCVDLGNALRARGDLDGAIGAYREALDGHPDYVGARANLAMALEMKGDRDGAIAELREGGRFGKDATGYLRLGNGLFRMGLRDEAIESYRKAVALGPKLSMAHYNLATALLEKKECLEEATASFRNAIASRIETKRPVRSLPPSKPPPARHRPGACSLPGRGPLSLHRRPLRRRLRALASRWTWGATGSSICPGMIAPGLPPLQRPGSGGAPAARVDPCQAPSARRRSLAGSRRGGSAIGSRSRTAPVDAALYRGWPTSPRR
jgi:tetratricopeptide (TPR) repeat protein